MRRWGWLFFLLVSSSVAGAHPVVLVPTDDRSRTTVEGILDALSVGDLKVKLSGPKAAATLCLAQPQASRAACFVDAAAKSQVDGVVLFTATPRGAKFALSMQLLAASDGAVLDKENATAPKAKVRQSAATMMKRLATTLNQHEAAKPPEPIAKVEPPKPEPVKPEPAPAVVAKPEPAPVKNDKPVVTSLTPREKEREAPDLRLEDTAPRPGSGGMRAAAWTATGVAIAAAGVAGTFGGLGMASKGRLESAPGGVSPLSYSDAVALQGTTNTQMTVAVGAGIGAGVAAAVATILWAVQ